MPHIMTPTELADLRSVAEHRRPYLIGSVEQYHRFERLRLLRLLRRYPEKSYRLLWKESQYELTDRGRSYIDGRGGPLQIKSHPKSMREAAAVVGLDLKDTLVWRSSILGMDASGKIYRWDGRRFLKLVPTHARHKPRRGRVGHPGFGGSEAA